MLMTFSKNLQEIMKKNILGTSDAVVCPSDLAYYIEHCRILRNKSDPIF